MITDNPLISALLPLSYKDTQELCGTSRSMYQLCQTEQFWQTKAASKYGKPLPTITPAQRYNSLELSELKYLPLVSEKQIELLNFLSYHDITQDMVEGDVLNRAIELIDDKISEDPNFYQNVTPSNDVDTIAQTLVDLADKPLINLSFLVLKCEYSPVLNNPFRRIATIDQQLLLINHAHTSDQTIAIKPIEIINKSQEFNFEYGIDYHQGGYTNGIPTLKLHTDPSIEPLSYRIY